MALRTSLHDVAGLPDPLLSHAFDLFFPRIPGFNGGTRGLTVRCMSTSLPGMQLEQETAALHGVEVSYAGRQIWTKTFPATFIATRDAYTQTAFRSWITFARNNRGNSGNYKVNYAVDTVLTLYDDIPNVIDNQKIIGVFPTSLEDLSVDGGAGTILQFSVQLSFDWMEPI